jgi:hypothetical protein
MGEAREHHMFEQVRLVGQRRVELGVRMAVGTGPPRGDEVEDLVPLGIEQRGAFGARDDDGIALGAVLGEGMPDMPPVACEHLAGSRVPAKPVARVVRIVVHGSARASLARSSSG